MIETSKEYFNKPYQAFNLSSDNKVTFYVKLLIVNKGD